MSWASVEEALTLGHGTERAFLCPVHGDTNASASVNSLTGLWFCYTCGARGKVDIDRIEISIPAIVREIERTVAVIEGPVHQYYSESWLSLYDGAGPGEYWLSRFNLPTCRFFRLGTDPAGLYATYPYRDSLGHVLGIVRRDLTGQGPKYRYPKGVDVSKSLFNYSGCSGDEIVLVEGATDAMAAWECNYDAMAVYSAHMSRAQARLLRRYNPRRIIMASDQDEAGDRLAQQVIDAFPHIQVDRLTWPEKHGKDLSGMSIETRTEVLALSRVDKVASTACGSSELQASSATRSLSTSRPVRVRRMQATG